MQTQANDYWKLFKPSACSLSLKGLTKEEIFQELVGNFIKAKLLSAELADAAAVALVERERLASTGVGQGVAIPHVKLAGLEQAIVSLSLLPEGMEWQAVDGAPVRIVFAVLRPARAGEQHDPDRHLEMMRWISNISREPDFRRFALNVSNRTELVDLLKEMSGAG